MRNPRLASVYAKSLIEVAEKQQQLDAVVKDMQLVKEACTSSKEFYSLLISPIISEAKKSKIVAAILKDKVSPLSWSFITLVLNKGREAYLDQIADAIKEEYNNKKGIHEVKLTTAVPADETIKNTIVNFLKQNGNFNEVKLHEVVDQNIIGGFKLDFDNNLVDASVSRKLADLRKEFANS